MQKILKYEKNKKGIIIKELLLKLLINYNIF